MMPPTAPSTSLDEVSEKMKERKNGILKKTKYNASLVSKIKTKILNNSSIMKVSLKNNNKALALALAEEKTKYRKAEQDKMNLQKEINVQTYDISILRQKLSSQNAKICALKEILMRTNCFFSDAAGHLTTAISTCTNDLEERCYSTTSSQGISYMDVIDDELPLRVPVKLTNQERIQTIGTELPKRAIEIPGVSTVPSSEIQKCQSNESDVHYHERVSLSDPKFLEMEQTELEQPVETISNPPRFAEESRTSTRSNLPIASVSLDEQVEDTQVIRAMFSGDNVTLRKTSYSRREASKNSIEIINKSTSQIRASSSHYSVTKAVCNEFSRTQLAEAEAKLMDYSNQLSDLTSEQKRAQLLAEKPPPNKYEETVFDADMDLTANEVVDIVVVATKSAKRKTEGVDVEMTKMCSETADALRKVKCKKAKKKICNSDKTKLHTESRRNKERINPAFEYGFLDDCEQGPFGIQQDDLLDWRLCDNEHSLKQSQISNLSEKNICDVKKVEQTTFVPHPIAQKEVEIEHDMEKIDHPGGVSNNSTNILKERVGRRTFVVLNGDDVPGISSCGQQRNMMMDEYKDDLEKHFRTVSASPDNINTKKKDGKVSKGCRRTKNSSGIPIFIKKAGKQREMEVAHLVSLRESNDILAPPHNNLKQTDSRRTFVVHDRHSGVGISSSGDLHDVAVNKRVESLGESNALNASQHNINLQKKDERTFVAPKKHKNIKKSLCIPIMMEKDELHQHLDCSEDGNGISNASQDSLTGSVAQRNLVNEEQHELQIAEVSKGNSNVSQDNANMRERITRRTYIVSINETNNGIEETIGRRTFVVNKNTIETSSKSINQEKVWDVCKMVTAQCLDCPQEDSGTTNAPQEDINRKKERTGQRTSVIPKGCVNIKDGSSNQTVYMKNAEQHETVTAEHLEDNLVTSNTSQEAVGIKENGLRILVTNKVHKDTEELLFKQGTDQEQCQFEMSGHFSSPRVFNKTSNVPRGNSDRINEKTDQRTMAPCESAARGSACSVKPQKKSKSARNKVVKNKPVKFDQNSPKGNTCIRNTFTEAVVKTEIATPDISIRQMPRIAEGNLQNPITSDATSIKKWNALTDVTNTTTCNLNCQLNFIETKPALITCSRSRRQAASVVSYKEPGLNKKLRRGDQFTNSDFLNSPVFKSGKKKHKSSSAPNVHN